MRYGFLKLFVTTSLLISMTACDMSNQNASKPMKDEGTQNAPENFSKLAEDVKKDLEKQIAEKFEGRISDEVKKQVEERMQGIEKKIVMPSASSSSDESKSAAVDSNGVFFELKKGFADIAAKTSPAVVNVSTAGIIESKPGKDGMPPMGPGGSLEDLFKDFFDQQEKPKRSQSVGSGFIIQSDDKDTYVITNNHVVSDAKKITIILADKTELEGFIHAADERTDLAVIKVKTETLAKEKRILPVLGWGNSDDAKVGQFVLAIGNPFGLGNTVTSGIISGKGRDIILRARSTKGATDLVDDFIQHDASINMGNSGGVLLDMEGKVIGINTAIFSPSGGNVGVGFAIPSTLAKQTIDQLIKFGHTKRGWLGVKIYPVTNEMAESLGLGEKRGGIVMEVTPDSPAAKAGFKEKDIIIEFNERKLDDKMRLSRIVSETEVGKKVKVKILRDGKDMILEVTLGEFPSASRIEDIAKQKSETQQKALDVLGMMLVEVPKDLKSPGEGKPINGVLIIDVKEKSSAEDSGLQKGDIINEINTKAVKKPEDIKAVFDESRKSGRSSVLLSVTRRGMPQQFVVVQFKSISDSSATEEKKGSTKDSSKDAKNSDEKKSDEKTSDDKKSGKEKAVNEVDSKDKDKSKESKDDQKKETSKE